MERKPVPRIAAAGLLLILLLAVPSSAWTALGCTPQDSENRIRVDAISVIRAFDAKTDEPRGVFLQVRMDVRLSSAIHQSMMPLRAQPIHLIGTAGANDLAADYCGGRIDHSNFLAGIRAGRFKDDFSDSFPSAMCFYLDPKGQPGDLALTINLVPGGVRSNAVVCSAKAVIPGKDLEKPTRELALTRSAVEVREHADETTGEKKTYKMVKITLPASHSEALNSNRAVFRFGGAAPDRLSPPTPGSVAIWFDAAKEPDFDHAEILFPDLGVKVKCSIQAK